MITGLAGIPRGAVAFEGGELVVEREFAEKKIRRKLMSPSTMNALAGNGCQARFAIDKLSPWEEDVTSAAGIGTLAHSVLEDLYQLPGDERTPYRAAAIALKKTEKVDFSQGRPIGETEGEREILLSTLRGDVQAAYSGIFELEDPSTVDVFGVERKLDGVEIRGVPVTGYIDRTDVLSDGTLRVNDYKSGKQKKPSTLFGDPHGDQLRIYAMALSDMLDREVSSARVLYTKFGKMNSVAMSKPRLTRTAKLFEQTWNEQNDAADAGRYATTPSGLCAYCPLASICPSVRTETTPQVPQLLGEDIPVYQAAGEDGHADDDPRSLEEETAQENNDTPAPENEQRGTAMDKWVEDKPWVDEVNDRVQPNSEAFKSALGVTVYAVKVLSKAGQPTGRRTIRALSSALASIVDDVVAGLGGRRNQVRWSTGLHSRVRYVLWTYIDDIAPVPFGADHDTWAQWRSTAVAATMSMIATAEDLYDGEIPAGGERVFITGDIPAESDEEPPESEVLPDGGADDEGEDSEDESEDEADDDSDEEDEPEAEDEKPARKSRKSQSSADDTAAVLEAMAGDDDDADDFDNYFD